MNGGSMFDAIPDGDVSDHAAQVRPQIDVSDAHSALHALSLRNHGTAGDQRDGIVNRASQYAPDAASSANSWDADCSDMAGDY